MMEKKFQFKLVPVAAFDARRGYSRWVLVGVGTTISPHPFFEGILRPYNITADLWIDKQGVLFTRFTSMGYTSHYRLKSTSEKKITPDMQHALLDFLMETLMEWDNQGPDEDLEGDMVEYKD